jgi:iron complex transport system permease protein
MKYVLLITLLLAGMLANILSGKIWIPLELWLSDGPHGWIMAELRLPRMVLAASIGASLGLSGAVLQGYLRNPLADPGLIGVSSGAALGTVTCLFLGFTASTWLLPIRLVVRSRWRCCCCLLDAAAMSSLSFWLG